MSQALANSSPSQSSTAATNTGIIDITSRTDPSLTNPLTNGALETMGSLTDTDDPSTSLFDASSPPLATLNGIHNDTPLTTLSDPSNSDSNSMLEEDEHSPGPYLDEMEIMGVNGVGDKLDSEDDLDERNRLIRLNGDDGGSSSQGSSQDSSLGERMLDMENQEPDLRRVKVRIAILVFWALPVLWLPSLCSAHLFHDYRFPRGLETRLSSMFEACFLTKCVQVYELVAARWTDRGTAFCQGDFDQDTEEARLIARAEDTHEVLLNCVVRISDVYQRQQDTLIVWTEPDGTDFALSFQDAEGCNEVWEFITEVQRHLTSKGASRVGLWGTRGVFLNRRLTQRISCTR